MKRQYKFTSWWLTGFAQADGSFVVNFEYRQQGVMPYRPRPLFVLTQSSRELDMMVALHNYLGVGNLRINQDRVDIVVSSLAEIIQTIIPHFDKYTPYGGKRISYLIFRSVVFAMKEGKHNNLVGLLQILDFSYFMHSSSLRTLSGKENIFEVLRQKFGVLPEFKPLHMDLSLRDISPDKITGEYIGGLTDGDGSINFSFSGLRRRVVANYTVTMGNEDYSVLILLQQYFGCGTVYILRSDASRFTVENSRSLVDNVLPVLYSVHMNTVKQTYLKPSFEV